VHQNSFESRCVAKQFLIADFVEWRPADDCNLGLELFPVSKTLCLADDFILWVAGFSV